MGAHLNAYSTREHTAYYIKALSKDLPKGDAWGNGRDRDSTPEAEDQHTGLLPDFRVWLCSRAARPGCLCCYWSPVAHLMPHPVPASSCGAPGRHCAELQPGRLTD